LRMSNTKKSLSRRLTTAALLTTLLASGGAVAAGVSSAPQTGDGPPRCCYKSTP